MINEQALIPQLISQKENKIVLNIISLIGGVLLLSLLAQVAIKLPWTPVPITGQTFGVALIALTWGRVRGLSVILTYLIAGAAGAPIFAFGKSGFALGPTSGYLIGMIFSSFWMGYLADLGWTKNFKRSWFAAFSGSLITFSFGVFVLSFFVPKDSLFLLGVLPFLPGDFVKTILASFIAFQFKNSHESKI